MYNILDMKKEMKKPEYENMREFILQSFQKYDTVLKESQSTYFTHKKDLVRVYRSGDFRTFEFNSGQGVDKIEFSFSISIYRKQPSITVTNLNIDDYLHIPVYILKTFETCDKAYPELFESYKKERAKLIEDKLRDLALEKERLEKESESL